jgi:hypothetical protein
MPVGLARHELAPKYVDVRPGSARAATPQGDGAFYLILPRLASKRQLLPGRGQADYGWHFDIRRSISKRVELLRI